jgi:type III restriction enzyme
MKKLNEILDALLEAHGQDFYNKNVPDYIATNLKQRFDIRPYQKEAFGRFVFYWEQYKKRPRGIPTQLLYHMATGSGKTLIMAGLLLYLYQKGYRNFLFFVNNSNIIEKTKENFLNPQSSKYLFADTVSFVGTQVQIRQVANFQTANADDINICFSTVQGLHSSLNTPREDVLTYDDFENTKIVLISDEAHHINAETKKGKEIFDDETSSWEGTVTRIFNAHPDNVMLEFTATVDLSDLNIADKYENKLIFDYPLRQFRIDGYSKEVQVLQADLKPMERALQSVLLSQYRRKMFEKYGLHIKPVVLLKSKTIADSQLFQKEFVEHINNLNTEILQKIKAESGGTVVEKMFDYCVTNGVSLENLVVELQEDFREEKLISVNSKEESEAKQIAVNTLEDESNEYRVIFAVDKLNEGWDVLNLFDIVRLYDTRDSGKGKIGKTTMQEAQLIGRGARYCPFKLDDSQSLFMRKYDKETDNELRICEELYYHSSHNPKYIQELNMALVAIGIKAPNTVQRELKIKPSFAQSPFYKTGFLFKNEQQKYSRNDIFSLDNSIVEQTYTVKLKTGFTNTSQVFADNAVVAVDEHLKSKEMELIALGELIIRKAMQKLDFYRFDNIKKYLPNLQSTTEFITSDNYLGKVKIHVTALSSQIDNLTPQEKIAIAVEVLANVSTAIGADKIAYKGTTEFMPFLIKDIIKDKVLNYALDENSDKETGKSMSNPVETSIYLDLSKKDWYAQTDCFCSSEEKFLIKYIDGIYDNLAKLYDEIYLVRNERYFKIYAFEDGRPTEPDFVLFLINQKEKMSCQYQIFIEPKGPHLLETDKWKENFFLQIKDKAVVEQLWQGKEYNIWGLPFYNATDQSQASRFQESFKNAVLLS